MARKPNYLEYQILHLLLNLGCMKVDEMMHLDLLKDYVESDEISRSEIEKLNNVTCRVDSCIKILEEFMASAYNEKK